MCVKADETEDRATKYNSHAENPDDGGKSK